MINIDEKLYATLIKKWSIVIQNRLTTTAKIFLLIEFTSITTVIQCN